MTLTRHTSDMHAPRKGAVLIMKADGETEPFEPQKLRDSLERAGTSAVVSQRVLGQMEREIENGMTTEHIYKRAFEILKSEEAVPVAARYSIKRAVFDLGPSGFPFEQFLAEVMRAHGWSARTGVTVIGKCAPHEIDVLIEKGGKRVGIEAKFHNDRAGKTDIKDALYVHARYEDLALSPDRREVIHEGWLVTNTRFTHNAIRYAHCSNLTLLGWDYPKRNNLFDLIEEAKVHPLTCLTTLSESEKRRFLESKIVLCRDIQVPHLLRDYGVRPDHVPQVLTEARQLCGT